MQATHVHLQHTSHNMDINMYTQATCIHPPPPLSYVNDFTTQYSLPTLLNIRYIVIWKLVNGEWRLHVEIFNSNVNPQALASVDGSSTYSNTRLKEKNV